jgi:hypothetical protein
LLHLEGAGGADPKRLEPEVLGLVRPIRIDHFSVTGAKNLSVPEVLQEGASVREMITLPSPPASVDALGKIWAEPFRQTISASRMFGKATAAFVFSEHQYTSLDDSEQMVVAMQGQVVSPVTSYIAAEPGTRPSSIGLGRLGSCGTGSGYGSGAGSLGGMRHVLGQRPDLQALLAQAASACGAGAKVSLEVETTRDEIVDITLQQGSGQKAHCIVEAAWALRLPPASRSFDRERYSLSF